MVMRNLFSRRSALACAAALLAGLATGCQQSNDIPLVKFPEGSAPPPPPSKDAKPPAGANTSQGAPAT
jgi:hypothetical protein